MMIIAILGASASITASLLYFFRRYQCVKTRWDKIKGSLTKFDRFPKAREIDRSIDRSISCLATDL